MPWNPQIPPAHNQGNNFHPWNGLRFVLVKLDNQSLHIAKTRWAVHSTIGEGATRRFNGSTGNGAGYTYKIHADRGGNSPSCDVQTSGAVWDANASGHAITSGGPNSGNSITAACIPWMQETSTQMPNTQPTTGWRTMIDCVSGWEGASGASGQWSAYQHMARPNVSNYSCTSSSGGPLNYAIDPGDMHPNTPRVYYSTGSSGMLANNGKGAYNDSLWFHENQFAGSTWNRSCMGCSK